MYNTYAKDTTQSNHSLGILQRLVDDEELNEDVGEPISLSSGISQETIQKFHSFAERFYSNQDEEKPNNTGIPDDMKQNFEQKSGLSFDDVKVHYNSHKPAQLQALAYTQGNQVYIGPGQEEHLGHELGHVVQQKQGRVKPTAQLAGVAINDAALLESEADSIGVSVQRMTAAGKEPIQMKLTGAIVQFGKGQRARRAEESKKVTRSRFVEEWGRAKNAVTIEFDGKEIHVIRGDYPKWEMDGIVYHITIRGVITPHVSEETVARKKYFFTGTGMDIVSHRPGDEEKGRSSEMFNKLPKKVQDFVMQRWSQLFS